MEINAEDLNTSHHLFKELGGEVCGLVPGGVDSGPDGALGQRDGEGSDIPRGGDGGMEDGEEEEL